MYHIAIERKGHAKAGKAIGITRISHKRQVGMFGSSSIVRRNIRVSNDKKFPSVREKEEAETEFI